jgi:Family of unknown function (DUF5683)
MKRLKYFIVFSNFILLHTFVYSQHKDSLAIKKDSTLRPVKAIDSFAKKKHDPHKATLYSAILPGLGQVYNKKYWKVPIVYAAIGIPAYTYFYNKTWYKKTSYALAVLVNGSYLTSQDSLLKVDPKLLPFITAGASNSLINYRNEFRKDQDYSALIFLLFWGLNVLDATVDAHLKDFDVGSELSLQIKPAVLPGFNTAGISFVFDIHKAKPKIIDLVN